MIPELGQLALLLALGVALVRCGDFVLYRPSLQATIIPLWFGPAPLVIAGTTRLVLLLRHRSRPPEERFELEEMAAGEGAG